MDCVEVCPVDCFYEGENMLVIHPDECIDCGVCVPECPVDAIKPDTDPGLEEWLSLNAKYAKIWPNITVSSARFLLGSMLTRAISADLAFSWEDAQLPHPSVTRTSVNRSQTRQAGEAQERRPSQWPRTRFISHHPRLRPGPHTTSRRPGPSRNWTPALSCAAPTVRRAVNGNGNSR